MIRLAGLGCIGSDPYAASIRPVAQGMYFATVNRRQTSLFSSTVIQVNAYQITGNETKIPKQTIKYFCRMLNSFLTHLPIETD